MEWQRIETSDVGLRHLGRNLSAGRSLYTDGHVAFRVDGAVDTKVRRNLRRRKSSRAISEKSIERVLRSASKPVGFIGWAETFAIPETFKDVGVVSDGDDVFYFQPKLLRQLLSLTRGERCEIRANFSESRIYIVPETHATAFGVLRAVEYFDRFDESYLPAIPYDMAAGIYMETTR
jgi:hypothetical protein